MRYHYWQFLVNQEGQPINLANITIYVAGTNNIATVYKNEFTGDVITTSPHAITNGAGFFEFWIGDEEEQFGYPRGTKFKLVWNREGIASGTIDWVDIFPLLEGVDEQDNGSVYKNKLLSNALAYKWNSHVESSVLTDGFPLHGLMPVDPASEDALFNKILSNEIAKKWEDHVDRSFLSASANVNVDNPHNLQPTNLTSSDEVYNKLVNNALTKGWEDHKTFDYSTMSVSASGGAHGILPIDLESDDETHNRLVSNKNGQEWENHKNYIYNSTTASGSPSAISAHGLEGVDVTSTDQTFNKLVSNKVIGDIYNSLTQEISNREDADSALLAIINDLGAYTETISTWTPELSGFYSKNIIHNLDSDYPMVNCWDTTTKKIFIPDEIESIDSNTIKITTMSENPAVIKIFK